VKVILLLYKELAYYANNSYYKLTLGKEIIEESLSRRSWL